MQQTVFSKPDTQCIPVCIHLKVNTLRLSVYCTSAHIYDSFKFITRFWCVFIPEKTDKYVRNSRTNFCRRNGSHLIPNLDNTNDWKKVRHDGWLMFAHNWHRLFLFELKCSMRNQYNHPKNISYMEN